jgi:glutathione reductase (NADPH)
LCPCCGPIRTRTHRRSERNLKNDRVDYHEGYASFLDPKTLQIETAQGEKYTVKSKVFSIAVGGRPTIPSDDEIPGASYGIDSDGFFELEQQPKRVAVVGAGYIAVELAGVFNTLNTETHLVIRYDQVLRTFDPMLSEVLVPYMGERRASIPPIPPSYQHHTRSTPNYWAGGSR